MLPFGNIAAILSQIKQFIPEREQSRHKGQNTVVYSRPGIQIHTSRVGEQIIRQQSTRSARVDTRMHRGFANSSKSIVRNLRSFF
jgi:hypothetical protein